jgi:hypothetical protein
MPSCEMKWNARFRAMPTRDTVEAKSGIANERKLAAQPLCTVRKEKTRSVYSSTRCPTGQRSA